MKQGYYYRKTTDKGRVGIQIWVCWEGHHKYVRSLGGARKLNEKLVLLEKLQGEKETKPFYRTKFGLLND